MGHAMKRLLTIITAATTLTVGANASAGVIFYDSFEGQSVHSWGVFQDNVGDNGDWTAANGAGIEIQNERIGITQAHSGKQYIELDSDHSRGGVSGSTNSAMIADISFATGKTYAISFAYKPRTRIVGDNKIALFALTQNGNQVSTADLLTIADETSHTLRDWMMLTVLYTAREGMNAIGFAAGGRANSLGGFIDSVMVSEVPIPGAIPLFFAGIAGLVGARGRGKKRSTST